MPVVVTIAALALFVWLIAIAPKLRLWYTTLGAVVIAYPLGHTFWHPRLGPLPITTDRVLLVAVIALLAYRWRVGSLTKQPWTLGDWCLLGWLGWLSASAFASLPDDPHVLPTSPLGRLAFSFWIPALLYMAARQVELTPRVVRAIFATLTLLGVYLGFTAVAEYFGQWWAVFPRYIADPTLGLHFGRARGPALNSVCLGVYLSVCIWAAWSLLPSAQRLTQLLLLGAIALMSLGVLLTLTRSVWIGLAVSALWMLFAHLPQRIRWPVTLSACVVGGVLLLAAKSAIVGMQRENSTADAAHSVQQRAAFAYVSWHMLQDHPLWGVGFGRFYDQKLPYLTDRRQSFELESIRDLHHHNTFLSYLTETGMIGFAGFLAVFGSWSAWAWRLTFAEDVDPLYRGLGRVLFATLLIYASSAAFHDLTLLPQDQWLVFYIAGLGVAAATTQAKPLPSGLTSQQYVTPWGGLAAAP